MGKTVKTYRSLRTQNVDGQVRHFGDFVPEAVDWPNLATYLRSHYVEETFIDSDDLAEQLELQRANDLVIPAVVETPTENGFTVTDSEGNVRASITGGRNVVQGIPETVATTKVPLTPEEIDALVEHEHAEPVLTETVIEDGTEEPGTDEDDDVVEEIKDETPEDPQPAVKLKFAKKTSKKGKK